QRLDFGAGRRDAFRIAGRGRLPRRERLFAPREIGKGLVVSLALSGKLFLLAAKGLSFGIDLGGAPIELGTLFGQARLALIQLRGLIVQPSLRIGAGDALRFSGRVRFEQRLAVAFEFGRSPLDPGTLL